MILSLEDPLPQGPANSCIQMWHQKIHQVVDAWPHRMEFVRIGVTEPHRRRLIRPESIPFSVELLRVASRRNPKCPRPRMRNTLIAPNARMAAAAAMMNLALPAAAAAAGHLALRLAAGLAKAIRS